MVGSLDNDYKALKLELYKLSWYIRGSVTIEDAFALSWEDRQLISEVVEDNLETTKKSGLPFF
jgi:hypothetical protein